MATVREFLDQSGFDWDNGSIVIQMVNDDGGGFPGWADTATPAVHVSSDDAILDRTFDDGFGGPECPRYIARDNDSVYFPSQYDGATSPICVCIDLGAYTRTDGNHENTPYPGG